MKLKTAVLVGNFPPPFGGVPTHIEYLAHYLSNNGWKVDVITPKFRGKERESMGGFVVHSLLSTSKLVRLKLLVRHIIKVICHLNFFLAEPREFVRSLLLYEQIRQVNQIREVGAVAAYHIFPAGLAAAWISADFGIPFLTTIFGEIYEGTSRHQRWSVETALVLNSSAKLLSCSEHCANSVHLLGDRWRVDTLYYGIDTHFFVPANDPGALKRKMGIDPEFPIILFVGRQTREMGLHVFLESARQVLKVRKNVCFFIAGRAAELTETAEKLAIEYPGLVKVRVDVPSDELVQIYQASDVVAIPSINLRACLGLAIIEGMSCGKPVVVSNIGGGPEVLSGCDVGVLVPPEDPAALAKALLSLIEDIGMASRMGANGREIAVSRFDFCATNVAMENLLLGIQV